MNVCDPGRDHHAAAQMAVTARQLTRIAGRQHELRRALERPGVAQGCGDRDSSDMGPPPLALSRR